MIQVHYQRRQWQPTPILLPGKSHGQKSLVGCSPWGSEESDTTEQLHSDFSLSCTGEGNCNPLQCSFLENPRDREAWWATVHKVAKSQTQLKRLSLLVWVIGRFYTAMSTKSQKGIIYITESQKAVPPSWSCFSFR